MPHSCCVCGMLFVVVSSLQSDESDVGLLQTEHDREREAYTHCLSALFARNPLRHALNNAHGFFVK